MSNLKHWQDKIKEKRSNTDFRDFLKYVSSWSTVILHKKNGVISRYPESDRIKGVLSFNEFEKIRDNLTDYGIDYDFDKGFFENLSLLMKQTYFPSRITFYQNENCDYSDIIFGSKNVYLSYVTINNCENILYSISTKDNCTNIYNSNTVFDNVENAYMTFGVIGGYNIFYSKFINNSNNIWFSTNMTGCRECILCNDLENISYYIKNKEYSKEEYFIKKEQILKNKYKFSEYYNSLDKVGKNYNTENSTGNFLVDCNDLKNGFNCYGINKGRNTILVGSKVGNENMYDVFQAGSPSGDDMYGVTGAGKGVKNLFISCNVNGGNSIFYCLFMEDCSYCIGCLGLRNKQYCILNKQYTKEEWEILADEILGKMDEDGILGDFFPGELNPFYFNDTSANLLGNFSSDEIKKEGYMWREGEIKVDIPENAEIVYIKYPPVLSDIPLNKGEKTSGINLGGFLQDYQGYDLNGEWKINPEILKKVIVDDKGNYYKIVKAEYDFLVKYSLPLPELHWLDRMKNNFGI